MFTGIVLVTPKIIEISCHLTGKNEMVQFFLRRCVKAILEINLSALLFGEKQCCMKWMAVDPLEILPVHHSQCRVLNKAIVSLKFRLITTVQNCITLLTYLLHIRSWLRDISPALGNKVWCDRDHYWERERHSEVDQNTWRPVQTGRPRSSRGTEDRPDAGPEDSTVLRDIVRSSFVPSARTSSPSTRCSNDSVRPSSPGDRLLERSPLPTTYSTTEIIRS